uniref:Uncharacterized protein n=1 Tax=Ciona intestinalis TaxID=7719 RepID=H2XP38_CIOIN
WFWCFIKTIAFHNKGTLQDYSPLFISLTFFSCVLIHPTEFFIAVFTRYIAYHMPSCQHHSVLYITVNQVH